MNLQENIRRILKEETLIPLVIRRRVSFEQIEEAFDNALERMGGSMNNPDSIIYKEKGTTLKTFAQFVVDEMVTYLEQDYFNDYNRIYFDDDEYYYNEIRKPLLKYYEKRIEKKFDEVKSDGLNESFLKEETNPKRDSLLNTIKQIGLYDFTQMTGLKYMDIVFDIGELPRDVKIQYLKDAVSDLEQTPGELDLTFITGSIPLYENVDWQMVYAGYLSNKNNELKVHIYIVSEEGYEDDYDVIFENDLDYETLETLVTELSEKLQHTRYTRI